MKSESGNEELLGGIIYYLQQIVGRRKYEVDVLTSVVSSLCLLLFPHSISSHTDTDTDGESSLRSLLSRIGSPPEADPKWNWSFEQPWKVSCSLDEIEACQSVLVVVSNVLGKKLSLSHFLTNLDVETSTKLVF